MLVGRGQEIAALSALVRESIQGSGILVVIRGPAASGKTTLLQALAEQIPVGDAYFLYAAASRAEHGLPLGIVDQLFRSSDIPPEVAPQVAGLIETGRPSSTLEPSGPENVSSMLAGVFEGLLKLLVNLSAGKAVVLAVDDLQYADLGSLRFLSYLACRISTSRILVMLTECASSVPAERLLRAEVLRQGNCHNISLAPFSVAHVAKLLSEHLDSETAESLASACHAMTGGNPLLVKALAEDARGQAGTALASLVPRSAFRSAVVSCLHRHELSQVELAKAVAVLGENATASLLGELLEMSPESVVQDIDALTASGLLDRGQFRHAAARQAVLERMVADERAAMHARAARTLYQAGAPTAVLAEHLLAAQRIGAGWVVPVLQDAAERALADGEPDRAIGYLKRAEAEATDDRLRAAIRFAGAAAEWRIDPERAVRRMAELVADARAGRLDGGRISKLAYYLLWVGYTSKAVEVLAALAKENIFHAPDTATRSSLEFLYPDLVGRYRRVVPQYDRATALIGAERILEERTKDGDDAFASITTALMTLICEDMLDRAAFWCNSLRNESGGRSSSPLLDAMLTGYWAMIETRRGNLWSAEYHASNALTLLTKKGWGVGIGQPLSSLLLSAVASGKHEDAIAYLRVPVPKAMFGTPYGLLYLYARGEYYLATGRAQAALADFQACGDRMIIWALDRPGLVPWRTRAAEAHLAIGNIGAARELSQEQLAQVGNRSSWTRGISLRALARTSPPHERVTLLKESAEVLRDSGARLELAYTFNELSNAHLTLGEQDRAQWAARRARTLMERCGAQTPDNGSGTGNSGRRERDDVVDERLVTRLSNAERRVASLAAYGYTNCQIAKKLFITVSTVEQHLTRVYRKLGVGGRVELPIEI